MKSDILEVAMLAGIEESEGIKRAKELGIPTAITGVDAIVEQNDIKIAFDCTSAKAHINYNAPALEKKGIRVIDLTPASLGPFCVPAVNLDELKDEKNLNMVTCAGQATIPIIYAVTRVAGGKYAEVVSSIASKSAGPGTRANMDEFTMTTTKAIEDIGGAEKGKSIIVLNPAEPPIMMTNTIIVQVKNPEVGEEAIIQSVHEMIDDLQAYVPGFSLKVPPIMEGDKFTTIIQVRGEGKFLPEYSGNLDIITSAAKAAGERIASAVLMNEVRE